LKLFGVQSSFRLAPNTLQIFFMSLLDRLGQTPLQVQLVGAASKPLQLDCRTSVLLPEAIYPLSHAKELRLFPDTATSYLRRFDIQNVERTWTEPSVLKVIGRCKIDEVCQEVRFDLL
jgi:hypothetical protein